MKHRALILCAILQISSIFSFAQSLQIHKDSMDPLLAEALSQILPRLKPLLDKTKLKVIIQTTDMGAIAPSAACGPEKKDWAIGGARIGFFGLTANVISINREVLKLKNTCGTEKILYLLKKTIIHELAHLFDLNGFDQFNRLCEKENPQTNCTPPGYGYISGHPRYLDVAQGYSSAYLKSPDQYEMQNPLEHFAVNFESFILDEEMQVRRPFLYHFFAEIFHVLPYGEARNESYPGFYLKSGKYFELPISRIKEIQYVHAGPGSELESRWGHSLTLITYCPDESPCLPENEVKLVASFRAFTGGEEPDYIKGFFGQYYSTVFFYTLDEVQEEYVHGEKRSLSFYPLRLSSFQKKQFARLLFENFWDRIDRYVFLKNNCSQETIRQLRRVFDFNHELQNENVLTPNSLKLALERNFVISPTPTHQIMPTNKPTSPFTTFDKDFEKYSQLSPADRLSLAQQEAAGSPTQAANIFRKYYLWERALYQKALPEFFRTHPIKSSGPVFSLDYRLNSKHIYGIPRPVEIGDRDQVLKERKEFDQKQAEAWQAALKSPEALEFLRPISENLKILRGMRP